MEPSTPPHQQFLSSHCLTKVWTLAWVCFSLRTHPINPKVNTDWCHCEHTRTHLNHYTTSHRIECLSNKYQNGSIVTNTSSIRYYYRCFHFDTQNINSNKVLCALTLFIRPTTNFQSTLSSPPRLAYQTISSSLPHPNPTIFLQGPLNSTNSPFYAEKDAALHSSWRLDQSLLTWHN